MQLLVFVGEKSVDDYLYKINPIMSKNRDVISNLPQINSTVFAERVRNLSNIQDYSVLHKIKNRKI
jgi:hypothetical protein